MTERRGVGENELWCMFSKLAKDWRYTVLKWKVERLAQLKKYFHFVWIK